MSETMNCSCRFSDATRCARHHGMIRVVCHCPCHTSLPENSEQPENFGSPDFSGEESVQDNFEDPRSTGMTRSQFDKIVVGAIKCAIDAHGDVTLETRSSAGKRIANTIYTWFNDRRRNEFAIRPIDLRARNRLVYLAQPYSDPNPDIMRQRHKQAIIATCTMMHHGIITYSPIVHNHSVVEYKDLGRDWKFWKRFDTTMLRRCNALVVLTLPGWEKSIGTTAEIKMANDLYLPVFRMDADREGYSISRMVSTDKVSKSGSPVLRLEGLYPLSTR